MKIIERGLIVALEAGMQLKCHNVACNCKFELENGDDDLAPRRFKSEKERPVRCPRCRTIVAFGMPKVSLRSHLVKTAS